MHANKVNNNFTAVGSTGAKGENKHLISKKQDATSANKEAEKSVPKWHKARSTGINLMHKVSN